jgi:hypothetical protein
VSPGRLTTAADVVRIGIACAAGVFVLEGDGSAALKAALVLAPALAARLAAPPPAFDLAFTLALGAEALSTGLGAHGTFGAGDTVSHILLPLLSAPILYVGLLRLAGTEPSSLPTVRVLVGAALVTTAAVLCLGAAWELVEWAADTALGTSYSQGHNDTLTDLRNNAIAATAGGVLVAGWLLGSAKRRPPSSQTSWSSLAASDARRSHLEI